SLFPLPERGEGRVRANAVVAVVFVVVWWISGAISLSHARESDGPSKIVAVLQPNIDQYRKWDESEAASIRAVFERLFAAAAPAQPDLMVWPETSVPGWLEDNVAWLAAL